jgi:hypothetical protein
VGIPPSEKQVVLCKNLYPFEGGVKVSEGPIIFFQEKLCSSEGGVFSFKKKYIHPREERFRPREG